MDIKEDTIMTDAHEVDPNREIEWIPTMKLSGSRSGNQVVPYAEIGWIPKRKFCKEIPYSLKMGLISDM